MPSAFTEKVITGEMTTFQEFAMLCARAMGVSITMRDDPLDKPIPEKFEPENYHLKGIQSAKDKLTSLGKMSLKDANISTEKSFVKEHDSWVEYRNQKRLNGDRCRAMICKVDRWTPPTSEHDEMKKFMLSQLAETLRFDGDEDMSFFEEPIRMGGQAWLAQQTAQANKDLQYHSEQYAKDIKRNNERNAWIRALRDSLEGVSV